MAIPTDPMPPAPGMPGNPLTLTDAGMMRALAHPARIAILQHLALDGPATATECADVAGLSPSACSYHLRALARFGYVEEDLAASADGRRRPWRARIITISLDDGARQPAAVRAAGRLLRDSLQTRIDDIRAQYRARSAEYRGDWRAAAGDTQDVLHLTGGELRALRAEIEKLLGQYRRLDPAERPDGARRVHAMLELLPWFDPAADS
jgi:DNA-binding transcriptional ArsR family regulator